MQTDTESWVEDYEPLTEGVIGMLRRTATYMTTVTSPFKVDVVATYYPEAHAKAVCAEKGHRWCFSNTSETHECLRCGIETLTDECPAAETFESMKSAITVHRSPSIALDKMIAELLPVWPEFDADCPICLRHHSHTQLQH